MDYNELICLWTKAFNWLYDKDIALFETDVQERAIAGRLAIYLQHEFDGKGGGVELLPEAGHLNVAVQLVDALLHAAQHLAGAHGHIVNGHAAGIEVGFRQQ